MYGWYVRHGSFFEQGYERASLQQIAGRAGVSTATLFKRFPTKASLFEAIVQERWDFDARHEKALRAGDPRAGLRKISREFAALARQPENIAFYWVFIAAAQNFLKLG